jgi:MFS family permease
MEIVFGYLLFLLFTFLMAFAVWGTLYITYLLLGLVMVVIKGIFKDRRMSEALSGDLDSDTKDLLALAMSIVTVGIAISIGDWTPVEIGMCLGAVVFYLQIWTQTGGTLALPFLSKKQPIGKEATYRVTDLGKPIAEMTQEERRTAAEKLAKTMLDQAQEYKKNNT